MKLKIIIEKCIKIQNTLNTQILYNAFRIIMLSISLIICRSIVELIVKQRSCHVWLNFEIWRILANQQSFPQNGVRLMTTIAFGPLAISARFRVSPCNAIIIAYHLSLRVERVRYTRELSTLVDAHRCK